MDWFEITFEITTGVIGNLIVAFIVAVSYQLSYLFAKEHYGWPGYKRVLWVIASVGFLFLLTEYQQLGPWIRG